MKAHDVVDDLLEAEIKPDEFDYEAYAGAIPQVKTITVRVRFDTKGQGVGRDAYISVLVNGKPLHWIVSSYGYRDSWIESCGRWLDEHGYVDLASMFGDHHDYMEALFCYCRERDIKFTYDAPSWVRRKEDMRWSSERGVSYTDAAMEKTTKRQRTEAVESDEVDPEHYLAKVVGPEDITYEIDDGSERYPVTYSGKIGRRSDSATQWNVVPHDDWTVLGMTTHHWSNRPVRWPELRIRLDREPVSGYLWDKDHGTTRRWGRKVKMRRL
jgi:hypothetical protein